MRPAKRRQMVKNRRESGRFVLIPHAVLNSSDYVGISYKSKALLVDLVHQYNGRNNGDLTAALGALKARGWVRSATLSSAVNELMKVNLIIRTREGKFQNPHSRCALYAITWQQIDECEGKDLEVSPTTTPPRKFSLEKLTTKYPLLRA
jgi:hypothetical protein|tara:strand:+ start:343 stop:789 length:447 start_codon:yes stop_codon:yes gene_type:complete